MAAIGALILLAPAYLPFLTSELWSKYVLRVLIWAKTLD